MKLFITAYTFIILCAAACGCGDDDIDSLHLDSTQLEAITVENEASNLALNDTLYLDIVFQDTFEIEDQTNSIEELLGDDILISGSMILNKNTAFDNPQPIILSSEEVIETTGNVNISEEFIQIELLKENATYKARLGIVLKEQGNFFIGPIPYLEQYDFFASSSLGTIRITTSIVNASPDNQFYFSVE